MNNLFIIYSCKKNTEKSELLYHLINDRLQDCKCYILYGDETLKNNYEIINNKYLIVNCKDNYENLCEKTICLCKIIKSEFSNVKGVFKCDDDIFPNIKKLNELILFTKNHYTEYLGNVVKIHFDHFSTWHYNKCSDEKYKIPKITNKCEYATGPLYYLSMKSIDILINLEIDYDYFFHEDNMVGNLLNKNNVLPVNYKTYYDEYINFDKGSLQNHKNNKNLYIHLHGGLGNQLFQFSAGYTLAKKKNMYLILLYKKDYKTFMTHNEAEDEFLKTIFNNFNYTYYENIDTSKLKIYKETRCFEYNDNIINEDAHYLLDGYFQNKNYIDNEIITVLNNHEICNKILLTYPLLNNSFFIHIRIGDYKNTNLYDFDKNTYYTKAINYILQTNENAHFFILSDDVKFVKQYDILKNINKTIITDMTTLDTFYFMSLCKNGGICANSTFSGWATKLNKNTNKIIICPKNWININYDYEIPFDYTISF